VRGAGVAELYVALDVDEGTFRLIDRPEDVKADTDRATCQ
jgi:hypothetical protein